MQISPNNAYPIPSATQHNAFSMQSNINKRKISYTPLHPLLRLTVATYPPGLPLSLCAEIYSAFEFFLLPALVISPPLVSRLLLTIWSRGRGGAFAAAGASFSPPPTLLCRRRDTASLRRPCRALGRRERSTAEERLLASMRASEDAASREGGRELPRVEVGVPVTPNAAKDVEDRARTGGLERLDEVGADGSSARSHIAVD